MPIHPAVRRLHNDLKHLRRAQAEHKSDVKDLRHDKREISKDRKELKQDVRDGKKLHRVLDKDRRELKNAVDGKTTALAGLEAKRQEILDRYSNDGFDSILPGSLPNPLMTAELQALEQRKTEVTSSFDAKIAGERTDIQEGKADILGKRAEIKKDRKEIKHDRKVIKHDRKELAHDRKDVRHDRKKALKDLRPAEYHMGLRATNRARHQLGLKSVDHVIRPAGPGHVTSTMKRLASAARSAAMSMGGYSSQGLCATGVSKAIRNAMGISVYGNGNQIDNNLPRSRFKEVKNMSLAQALKVPGLILTWERTSTSLGSIYGHTAITTGDGHTSASDFIESNTLAGSSGRSGLRIFVPRR